MKISKLSKGILVAVALTLFAAHSASAQGYVSFDAAASDVGAGLYCFDLTGVTIISYPGIGSSIQLSVGSPFSFSSFAAIGNTQNLGAISSPSGWHSFPNTDTDGALYQLNQLSWVYNGTFEISATPNLSGTIDWSFGGLNGTPLSGTATITSAPEPTSLALFSIAVVLLVIRNGIRVLSMTMWPNSVTGCNLGFPRSGQRRSQLSQLSTHRSPMNIFKYIAVSLCVCALCGCASVKVDTKAREHQVYDDKSDKMVGPISYGYYSLLVFTVPFDIVTFPIQLIVLPVRAPHLTVSESRNE